MGHVAQPMQSQSTSPQPERGEEAVRFARNFHDVFLSVGLALFALGLGLVTSLVVFQGAAVASVGAARGLGLTAAAAAFFDAAVMWLAAEAFARRRRLFLPSIVILLAFVWFVAWGLFYFYASRFGDGGFADWREAASRLRFLPAFVLGGASLATFAYYARTKLPFAMGLGAVGTALFVLALLFHRDASLLAAGRWAGLGAGVFLFALGVAFDARDPARTTRFADNAFWLHFFAAPLMFSGVAGLAGDLFGRSGGAATTLAVFVALAVLSVLINRRALLVSGLLSAGVAIAALIGASGLGGLWTLGVTLLTLGVGLTLLGAGWRGARRLVTAPFPKTGLVARIIPPEPR